MSVPSVQPSRVAIVGVGHVGATCAYALLLSELVAELVVIDLDRARAEGEAMDLNHAVPLTRPMRIWAGSYEDCAGAALTIVAAGRNQKLGETRHDLVAKNTEIFREIIPRIAEHNPGGIILVATNPVDVLAQLSWKLSGLPSGRVFGSGTVLDTARFRYLLSQKVGVDPRSIHGYIIGEHGDSEVPVWSLANIAGMRLEQYCATNGLTIDAAARAAIVEATRDAAYHIISRKGATYYAVAAGLLRIVEAIIRNQNTVLTVSTLADPYYNLGDVFLSLPAIVGRDGVSRVIRLDLNAEEAAGLRNSADVLRALYHSTKKERT